MCAGSWLGGDSSWLDLEDEFINKNPGKVLKK